MAEQHPNNTYAGKSVKNILKYMTPETVFLDFPFIQTHKKVLMLGMPYMKTENWLADSKTDAIRLLDVWDDDHFVYLKIQSLKTLKINTLSWNLDYKGGFWLWSITSLPYIINLKKDEEHNFLLGSQH